MRLFRKSTAAEQNAPRNLTEIEETKRLPAIIGATCLGESCPNFIGIICDDTDKEWISAGGVSEGRDTSLPPLEEDADHIIYSQDCRQGRGDKDLIAVEAHILKPENVNGMMMMVIVDRYGVPSKIKIKATD